jgi:hypothetical protein
MSGVSLDVRNRRDRGPCGCPYRALTLMEWRSRGLSPVSGATARLSMGRVSCAMNKTSESTAQDLWICG